MSEHDVFYQGYPLNAEQLSSLSGTLHQIGIEIELRLTHLRAVAVHLNRHVESLHRPPPSQDDPEMVSQK